jgi:hypothetical protein
MRYNLQEVKKEDSILSMLDAHKDAIVRELQIDHIPNDVD